MTTNQRSQSQRTSMLILTTILIIGSSMVATGAIPDLPNDPNRLGTEFELIDGQVIFEGDIILGSCTLGSATSPGSAA